MLEKDTRYCHNYAKVVKPHEVIDENKKPKTRAPKVDDDEELVDEGEGNPLGDKSNKKRKIKKMKESGSNEADRVHTSDHKSQKIEEVKEIEGIEEDEEDQEDDEVKVDDTKEEKKEAQKVKKPDHPLEEDSDNDRIEGSPEVSDLGFPSLGAGSENGGDD